MRRGEGSKSLIEPTITQGGRRQTLQDGEGRAMQPRSLTGCHGNLEEAATNADVAAGFGGEVQSSLEAADLLGHFFSSNNED